jgi:hypothetical protein
MADGRRPSWRRPCRPRRTRARLAVGWNRHREEPKGVERRPSFDALMATKQSRERGRPAFPWIASPRVPKPGGRNDDRGSTQMQLALKPRACCIWVESMALAHPPSCGAGRGGGSRGPRRLSNAPAGSSRRTARPPSSVLPHHRAPEGRPSVGRAMGEEAQRSGPRVNSKAEGARVFGAEAGQTHRRRRPAAEPPN